MSQEMRERIKLSLVGRKHTIESKEKMTRSKIGNKNALGKKWSRTKEDVERIKERYRKFGHPSFGKRYGKKLGSLKRQAMERDFYTCQYCHISDRDVLTVDHKLSKSIYPELKHDIDNLITLCANCHLKKTKKDINEGRLIVGIGKGNMGAFRKDVRQLQT